MGKTANYYQIGGDHYLTLGVEPWDVVDTWSKQERIGYYRGNALKYIMRMGKKGDEVEEVKKAIHYLEKLVEVLTEDEDEDEDED